MLSVTTLFTGGVEVLQVACDLNTETIEVLTATLREHVEFLGSTKQDRTRANMRELSLGQRPPF